ncbi:uncharacterized protein J3R85_017519 [Psidium guajava]|nr:uncharacterized protein J3R85_017519 [Psidium guajava]
MTRKIPPAALKALTNSRPTRSPNLYGELYRRIDRIAPSTTPFDPPPRPLLSDLSRALLDRILSDPHLHSSKCLAFFDYLLENLPSLSFRPNLRSHLILACRLLKATNFSAAERLLKSVLIGRNSPHPFPVIACVIEKCCVMARIRAKLLEMMFKVYSGHGLFDQASLAFDYMRRRRVQINERACTVHLLALKRSDQIGLCVEFFSKMVDSDVGISVYSLTVVVDGLCRNGTVKMARELVEQMSRKRVEPNIVTFNTLVDACVKWWNFQELDLVLLLMQKEGVEFNPETYKFLIDGYTSFGWAKEAEKLILQMHDLGLKVDTHLYNLNISAFGRARSACSAIKLFDEMTKRGVEKNADTYWALISGLCEVGGIEEVMTYVGEMQRKGIQMSEVMMERVVGAFCKRGMVDKAYNFLANTEKRETKS